MQFYHHIQLDIYRNYGITFPALYGPSARQARVEKRHDNVKRTIETLIVRGVITSPQIEEKPTAGRTTAVYVFESEEGKRDSIIVVAQLSPEFTARLVDRRKELEEQRQAELVAEMAFLNVEQDRRLYQVGGQVETVAEAVENIKFGTMRAG